MRGFLNSRLVVRFGPPAIALTGVAMIALGIVLVLVFQRVPVVVLEHPGSHAGAPQQALADLATQLDAISPYAQTHKAPPRPSQPRTGLWIEIPAEGISLPVVDGDGSDRIPYWEALVYPGTAAPGSAGNSYLYAHGIWGMFGGLLFAKAGDRVYLHDYSTRQVQTFVVSKVVGRVKYDDTRWLRETSPVPLLTLQTCVGWDVKGDRYIVQAVPASSNAVS
jgi:LPXTG-site transpeptidase (sortase) family protein